MISHGISVKNFRVVFFSNPTHGSRTFCDQADRPIWPGPGLRSHGGALLVGFVAVRSQATWFFLIYIVLSKAVKTNKDSQVWLWMFFWFFDVFFLIFDYKLWCLWNWYCLSAEVFAEELHVSQLVRWISEPKTCILLMNGIVCKFDTTSFQVFPWILIKLLQ